MPKQESGARLNIIINEHDDLTPGQSGALVPRSGQVLILGPHIGHSRGMGREKLKSLRVMAGTLVDDDNFEAGVGVLREEIPQGIAQRLVTIQRGDDDG